MALEEASAAEAEAAFMQARQAQATAAQAAAFKENYPAAVVCCINLPDRDIFLKQRAEIFNQIIESAVNDAGNNFFLADLYRSRLNTDFYYMNTTDGIHPDEDGMKIIAEIVEDAIRKHFNI